jgi:LPS-assembly protein
MQAPFQLNSTQNTQWALWLALTAFTSFASAQQVCLHSPDLPNLEKSLTDGQIQVKALDSQINQNTLAKFSGMVEIDSNLAKIKADQAVFDRTTQTLQASGDVSFANEYIAVSSESVQLNRASQALKINQTQYSLNAIQGHGTAKTIEISKEAGINLVDSSFSICPKDNQVWHIEASNIKLTENQSRGVVKHARFYVRDVPLMYLPYFSFPVNDERQTGILFPEIKNNTATGLSFEQPVYFNLAPNYDLTVSPRVMAKRGLQLKTEFRYLTPSQGGQVNIEYLANDTELADNDSRYFYRFVHSGQITDNWQFDVDLNGLSDDNYIADLGSDYYNRADTHLYKTIGLSYYSEKLSVKARLRDFEVLGESADSYRALPEVRLNYLTQTGLGVEFEVDSELAYFETQSDDDPTATRIHLAPTIRYPYQNQWSEFVAEATVFHTQYYQDNLIDSALEKNVTRTIGQTKVYGTLNFERQLHVFGSSLTQTLEPKVQYLYTSFEDQSNIGLYDTTRLFTNFSGLFRGQEFTGLDRINDNNQVTLGVTTRMIDENNREQVKLSLGQIFYLSDSRINDIETDNNRSALAAELDWQLSSKWYAHGEAQVQTSTDKVERSSLSLEYQLSKNKILQLNHRYVRNLSGEQIDQFGVTASWPLANKWQWVGRWYQDREKHRTVESYTGVQYQSCCWTMSLVAQRHLTNRFEQNGLQNVDEFESGIQVYFTSRDLLKEGLFGYRRPYLLN